jgi:hypothetical protein
MFQNGIFTFLAILVQYQKSIRCIALLMSIVCFYFYIFTYAHVRSALFKRYIKFLFFFIGIVFYWDTWCRTN